MKKIIQRKPIWLFISGFLTLLSVISLGIWGLNLGIDFTGGSLLEVKFLKQAPELQQVQESVEELNLGSDILVQPTENNGYILRFQQIEEETHQQIVQQLETSFEYTNEEGEIEKNLREERFEAIGPSIGKELRTKAIYSILVVLIAIVLYVAYAFRKVSWPIKSWKYGIIAIIALFHDILITCGIFAVLGHFMGVEIGLPFVAALLTILGYSVNDTIVVFDRIRENLSRLGRMDFEDLVNRSVNETLSRSVNTSITTLLVLVAIFLFGGVTIKFFVLALIIGVLLGTYSSLFLASPLLVVWEKLKK